MIGDLKKFLLRGNVVDLAVAVMLGLAFGAVITSFTDDVLMQVVAGIGGQPDFSALTIDLGDSVIRYGAFLNTVINFVIIGTVLFFVVRAFEHLVTKEETGPTEIELLKEIRDLLRQRSST